MNGQETYLGQWYDIVGQQRGGGGGGGDGGGRGGGFPQQRGGGGGGRHDGRGGRGRQVFGGYPYGYGGFPYGYGGAYAYDPYASQQQSTDPAVYAYLQQLQLQVAQQQQQTQQLMQQLMQQQGPALAPPPPGAPPPGAPAPAGAPPQTAGWYDLVEQQPSMNGAPFPSRAMVVESAPPKFAARDILPMSTGVPILPTQSAQITGRPQCLVFQCNRFLISNAGTAGGSADWIVNDIKIGNRSQFVQSGDVPGDLFATNAIDTFIRFESAQTAMDVVVVVTYIGLNESGAPFFGAMVGTAAV